MKDVSEVIIQSQSATSIRGDTVSERPNSSRQDHRTGVYFIFILMYVMYHIGDPKLKLVFLFGRVIEQRPEREKSKQQMLGGSN